MSGFYWPAIAVSGCMSGVAIILAIIAGELLAPGYVSIRNSFTYFWSYKITNIIFQLCSFSDNFINKILFKLTKSTSSLDSVSAIDWTLLFFRVPAALLFWLLRSSAETPLIFRYSSNCCNRTVSMTSFAAPWLHMVIAGNSMFLIGYAIVLIVVIVGLACHSTYVLFVE